MPASDYDKIDDQGHGTTIQPGWPFSKAADTWLADQKPVLKPHTIRSYEDNLRRLKEFFADKPLNEIKIGHIRGYQKERQLKAGAVLINGELSRLQSMLKEVDLWAKMGTSYKPLPIPKTKVRESMSEDQERKLVGVALRPGKRLVAGHCLVIMMNTTMGFGELSNVRRVDLKLDDQIPYVIVTKGKNQFRERTIPLNYLALRSFRFLIDRWKKAGGSDPAQYILFHRAQRQHAEIDFYQPQGHIYKAARGILKDAGLAHLDPYDMRSHAITKLLSDPKVSDQVSQEIAGHVSKAMQDRYSNQRLERKQQAVDAMSHGMIEEAARVAQMD